MRRIGLFSGNMYSSEDFDNDRIKECAVQIPSKMSKEEIDVLYKDKHKRCKGCYGCPEARRG